MKITTRLATTKDAKEIKNIYKQYVNSTVVTFEVEAPDKKEFKKRIKSISEKYPFIVAVIDDEIVGYGYANILKGRQGYNWSVETSLYVRHGNDRQGIGETIFKKLEKILKLQNITNMYACIGLPNDKSVNFHQKHGFKTVGQFHQCGYKLNRWCDVVWMEKIINLHSNNMKKFIPVSELKKSKVQGVLNG